MIFLLWCHGFSTVFLILMIGLEKSDFDAQVVCQSIIFRNNTFNVETKILRLNREQVLQGKVKKQDHRIKTIESLIITILIYCICNYCLLNIQYEVAAMDVRIYLVNV